MVERKRDASVGAEWLAYWALKGDEPAECLAEYMKEAADKRKVENFMIFALAEALDPEGDSEFQLKLVRRKRGKPINRLDRAHIGHRAANIVERLVADGIKQEAAIATATEQTGLSRAEIFSWLKHRRIVRDQPEQLGTSPIVDYLLEPFRAKLSSQKPE